MTRLTLRRAFAAGFLSLVFTLPARAEDAPAPAAAQAAEDEGIECHEERRTGSNIARRVCTTREQRERQRDAANTFMQRLDKSARQASPGGN